MNTFAEACDPWKYRKPNGHWSYEPPSAPTLALANPEYRTPQDCTLHPAIQYFPDGLGVDAWVCNGNGQYAWIAWCAAPAQPKVRDEFAEWWTAYQPHCDISDPSAIARKAWNAAKSKCSR